MMKIVTNKLQFGASALALMLCASPLYAAELVTDTARMQAMDKITGRVSEIDVPVNGEVNFGSFSIVVRKCVTRSPEETPENTAFVDIVDDYASDKPHNIFKGWMFSSSPALNAVEHPIYDVWLLKCYNSSTPSSQLLTSEQLRLRDEIPMAKTQADIDLSPLNYNYDTKAEPNKNQLQADNDNTISAEAPQIEEAATVEDTPKVITDETAKPQTADILPSETDTPIILNASPSASDANAPKSLFKNQPQEPSLSDTDKVSSETEVITDTDSTSADLSAPDELSASSSTTTQTLKVDISTADIADEVEAIDEENVLEDKNNE